jgi:hypothetical protein
MNIKPTITPIEMPGSNTQYQTAIGEISVGENNLKIDIENGNGYEISTITLPLHLLEVVLAITK